MRQSEHLSAVSLEEKVPLALRQWHDETVTESALRDLRCFQAVLHAQQRDGNVDERTAANALLSQAFQMLAQSNQREAYLLERRFPQQQPISSLAIELCVSEAYVFLIQRRALMQLVEVIAQIEAAA